jgi:hypothetical protein
MAISTNKGMLANSITTDYPNFQSIQQILTKIFKVKPRATLFLDNCSMHKALKVFKYMRKLRLMPFFNLPYSLELAAHETVINFVKNHYKKLRSEELGLLISVPRQLTLEIALSMVIQEHIVSIC